MRNTYLVLFIYLMIPMFSLAENTYTTQQREDSLLSLLKSSPTVDEQIELYKDLALLYITHGPTYPAIITIYKTGIAWFTGRIR